MLKQFRFNWSIKWVKNKVNPFATCQLSCRYEVAVASNKHNLIYLMLIRKGRNINANFHINTFLLDIWLKIRLRQLVEADCSRAQFL